MDICGHREKTIFLTGSRWQRSTDVHRLQFFRGRVYLLDGGSEYVHKMSTDYSFFWRGFSRRREGKRSKIIDIYLTYYLLYNIIYQYIIYTLLVNNPYNRKPSCSLLWGPRKNCGLWTTVDIFDGLRHPFARIGCRDPYPNKLFTKCPQMSTDYSFFPLPDKTESC